MHERKAMMADLSDAFIALPAATGRSRNCCEILTWAQLGLHQKPFGLLNVQEFYASFYRADRSRRSDEIHPSAAPRLAH
jgi:predicted Rossmann-fold nucleotide-binding protein